ncbi:EcoKI restriction-modification system protein HsdS [Flavobacterium columnare]|uniref:EcoKI restriction-modification system protein HsdS n=1 Tax=Flavobacterium columnare TaxID=996 RepID=A0A2N9PB19_9FLAO|nr:restriction endonuclease subunit S [Flavobacterium columnare]SPE77521.1 EcoKI restriction-modification system protein HsdS [Flavobacterium columnare]
MKSQMLLDNEKFRFDSDFFSKKYLKAYSLIKSRPNVNFHQITEILTDFSANGSYENIAKNFKLLDEENYAYMVRTTDLEKRNFIDGVKYIDENSYNFLEKSKIYGGELLINKIGSPGRVFIMPYLNKPVSLGMNLFMIRILKKTNYSEKYLWAFFNSDFGQKIIQRKVNGTVPLTIDKEAIKSLYIPTVSIDFQNIIESIIIDSESKEFESSGKYTQAETLLLQEIGFDEAKGYESCGHEEPLEPQSGAHNVNMKGIASNPDKMTTSMVAKTGIEPNVNVKSFKESFGITGRLDAEYYQKKYEAVVEKIKSQKYDILQNIVKINKSIEPGSNYYSDDASDLPFIRVSDYNKFGLSEPNKKLTSTFVNEIQDKIDELKPKKGTILFSKDGSVGTAYHLRENLEGVTSSAILHLKVKDEKQVIPEYLTLVLNSKLVQMQAERDAGGSIILHWRVGEIQKVVVPIIDYTKQQEIAQLIEESFSLKKQSEQLLEIAKKAVEIAIEENEEVAMAFINTNTI